MELIRIGDECIAHVLDFKKILEISKVGKKELISFSCSMERILILLVSFIKVQDEVMSGVSIELSKIRSDVSSIKRDVNSSMNCEKDDRKQIVNDPTTSNLFSNSGSNNIIRSKFSNPNKKQKSEAEDYGNTWNRRKNSWNILDRGKINREPAERKIIIKGKKPDKHINRSSMMLISKNSSELNDGGESRYVDVKTLKKKNSLRKHDCVSVSELLVSPEVKSGISVNTYKNLEVGVEISDEELKTMSEGKIMNPSRNKRFRDSRALSGFISGERKFVNKKFSFMYISGFKNCQVPSKGVWTDFFKIKSSDLIFARAISPGVRELLINVNVVESVKENLKLFLPECHLVVDRSEVKEHFVNGDKLLSRLERLSKVESTWNLSSVLVKIKLLKKMLLSEKSDASLSCCFFERVKNNNKQVKKFKNPGLNNTLI